METRIRAREAEEGCTDRLSNLPDPLIHHIFSFLDAKFAVQSCVLSTRFERLWTSLQNLNFDSSSFRNLPSFAKFVHRLLSHRDGSNISTLNFARRGSVEPRTLKEVISYALSHNVQQLSIHVSFLGDHNPSLPLVFNSQSLKTLILNTCFQFQNLPNSFNLPALTTLHLRGLLFSHTQCNLCLGGGSESYPKCLDLFSNCLNLKNLSLDCRSVRGMEVFNIYSPQLENLHISFDFNYPFTGEEDDENCEFVIFAPKLTSFYLRGFPPLKLSADDLPSLQNVEVRASSTNALSSSTHDRKLMYGLRLLKVLQELRNAEFVTLSSYVIEILSMVPELLVHQTSPFGNLKSLKIDPTTSIIPDDVKNYLLNCSPSAAVVF